MNLHGWGDVLFCLGGVYLTCLAYGWLPYSRRDEAEDEESRMPAMLKSFRIIGPLTTALGLMQIFFHSR